MDRQVMRIDTRCSHMDVYLFPIRHRMQPHDLPGPGQVYPPTAQERDRMHSAPAVRTNTSKLR